MKEEQLVQVNERWSKTNRGFYVYVLEGNELVHISEYSLFFLLPNLLSLRSLSDCKNLATYYVLPERLSGKVLYCFDFFNGKVLVIKCKIEDFKDGYPKKCEYLLPSELPDLKFRVKDPRLLSLLSEFYQLFTIMIAEVKEYNKKMGLEYEFEGGEERLKDAIRDPHTYYFTFMCLPRDESRIASLRVTRKWIYELWIMKLTCEALGVSKFLYPSSRRGPLWRIKQGSRHVTCIGETRLGSVSLWLEPKLKYRPDIVAVRGYFKEFLDLITFKKRIDLIIECKENPFNEWYYKSFSQLISYLRSFEPKTLILASLNPIPDKAKKGFKSLGFEVVDDLRPTKREKVKEFKELVLEKVKVGCS